MFSGGVLTSDHVILWKVISSFIPSRNQCGTEDFGKKNMNIRTS